MPSFLSKVFGRKKDEKDSTTAAPSNKRSSLLLEGKYEAGSPNLSPSATNFADAAQQRAKEKDSSSSLALFRSRSRTVVETLGSRPSNASAVPIPHLTLNLPNPKEEKARLLGVVFEADPDSGSDITSKDIAECRLSPIEALKLAKTCFDVIVSRGGLETLGLMHPHWHSASPETQQKLLTLFILSLPSRKAISAPSVSFNTELDYTRTVHDIAAVFRWALRHVRLDGASFGPSKGNDATGWDWYVSFAEKEREAAYPTTAFTKTLVPLLPAAHAQLLTNILDIVSSLAAHAETVGTSGSKLVKLFGLWLLTAERAKTDEQWQSFYKRWDTAGRVLEHVFLAYVREEDSKNKMPLRLSELVKQYPYDSSDASTPITDATDSLPFIPRPRFSTRLYDALFIRIDTRLPSMKATKPPASLPAVLLLDTIKCGTLSDAVSTEEAFKIWEEIKKVALEQEEEGNTADYPELARILDDETLRLFSLASEPQTAKSTSTAVSSPASSATQPQHRRSSSLSHALGNGASSDPLKKTAPASGKGSGEGEPSSPSSPSLTTWADFSMLGFGETSLLGKDFASGLLDNDVETTSPQLSIPSPKKRRASSPGRGRSRSRQSSPVKSSSAPEENTDLKTQLAQLSIVQIDEAFYDFWSDALLDPIASNWPQFIVCQLKPSVFPVNVLVVEHSYSYPPPPPPPVERIQSVPAPVNTNANLPKGRRGSSPGSNISSRKSTTLSPIKKRFSFFASVGTKGSSSSTTGTTSAGSVKPPRSPRIGEMGEILAEVEEPVPTITKKDIPSSALPKVEEPKGLGLAVAATATTAAAGGIATVASKESEPSKMESAPAPELTPAAELPPVPVIDVIPPTATTTTEFAPVATEPLKTNENTEKPVPTSASSPSEAGVPADVPAPAQGESEEARPEEVKVEEGVEAEVLPPAPEPVVLSGATPGPQAALESSEPIALAQVSTPADPEADPAPGSIGEQVKQDIPAETLAEQESQQPETSVEAPSAPEAGEAPAHSTEGSTSEPLPEVTTLSEVVATASVDVPTAEPEAEKPAAAKEQAEVAQAEELAAIAKEKHEEPTVVDEKVQEPTPVEEKVQESVPEAAGAPVVEKKSHKVEDEQPQGQLSGDKPKDDAP